MRRRRIRRRSGAIAFGFVVVAVNFAVANPPPRDASTVGTSKLTALVGDQWV